MKALREDVMSLSRAFETTEQKNVKLNHYM